MNILTWASLAIIATFLTACGGGGGSSGGGVVATAGNLVATFQDSPVAGLEFSGPTSSGTTDTNGNFTYRSGETVTFRIGSLLLGSVTPAGDKVTPLDIVNTSDTSDARVVRILQTLQSLDSDGDTSNGIQISSEVRETLRTQPEVDLRNALVQDADVVGLIGEFKVSKVAAISHFENHRQDASNAARGYTPESGAAAAVAYGLYSLIAWNDLGMHCVDGKDYSVFSILPPYNNLHAQLIRRDVLSGQLITAGVTLTYESVLDPMGSINTQSASWTNFWNWVLALFGADPGLGKGLNLGNPAINNPAPSATPAAMVYSAGNGWWQAEGIPVLPYDDHGIKNYYPMVKVVARGASGTVLASTKVVLPVSDEMSCKSCHASGSGAAARPVAGWINDPDAEKDWKKNILRLHDQKFPDSIATAGLQATYPGGSLLATSNAGKPILCASCHKSNALATPQIAGIKSLTEALHIRHANVLDPVSGLALDNISNRNACYLCHPGSATKCLRGAMGNAKNPDGSNAIDCQSCHGSMSQVGAANREGWLDVPACQHCHDRASAGADFTRHTSVFASSGQLRATIDTRFATNADTPLAGKSLYRFSKGHGGLQCEACHGSTHAEYPSSHVNDNVQSLSLQGHTGTIAECEICHNLVPTTPNGGPHGQHSIGQGWVNLHQFEVTSNGAVSCKTCHGNDDRGTALSRTSQARKFNIDGGPKVYAARQMVGCYDCHNGPDGSR